MKILREATVVRASSLSPLVQAKLLRMYVNRYTGDHKPAWVAAAEKDGTFYPVQFKNDEDWLRHTMVAATLSGDLDPRNRSVASTPTWPNGDVIRSISA